MLLKNALSLFMEMNLKTIVMNGVKASDWIHDVLDNEEVDTNDDFACDEGDMLDT